jgi:hypothetical protein
MNLMVCGLTSATARKVDMASAADDFEQQAAGFVPEHPGDRSAVNAMSQSSSHVRSLAMLIQIVRQLETYVRKRDLTSIHNEDVILGAALNELLTKNELVAPDQIERFRKDMVSFSQQVSALHLAEAASKREHLRSLALSSQTPIVALSKAPP